MSSNNNKSRWGQVNKVAIRSTIEGLASRSAVSGRKACQRAFKSFCKFRKYKINCDTSIAKLAEILEDYAFNMRREDGEEYKDRTLECYWNTTVRFLRKKFFEEYGKAFDPFHDKEFARARAARDGKRKILQADPTKRTKSSAALSLDEYTKMIQAYDPETPDGLMKRVFLLLMKDLAWRGEEALRASVEYFEEEIENDGTRTGILKYNPYKPQRRRKSIIRDKWLIPNDNDHSMCPVRLYKKMVSLRPANAPNNVFLRQNDLWQTLSKSEWYTKSPVGMKSMYTWISKAAKKIGLKGQFTNRNARSSAVAHLAEAGVSEQLAMRITGYKRIKSLQLYMCMQKEGAQEIINQVRSEVRNTTKPCVAKSVPEPSKSRRIITTLQPNVPKSCVVENVPESSRGQRNTAFLQPYVRIQRDNLQQLRAQIRAKGKRR